MAHTVAEYKAVGLNQVGCFVEGKRGDIDLVVVVVEQNWIYGYKYRDRYGQITVQRDVSCNLKEEDRQKRMESRGNQATASES